MAAIDTLTSARRESFVSALITKFAPPERLSDQEIASERRTLNWFPMVQQVLNSSPEPMMILNRCRQIVMVNDKLMQLLGPAPVSPLGRRPGEIFNCIHANDGEAGCGTSEFCKECGAVQAICESQETTSAQSRECRMTCQTRTGEASLDLRVWATPLACDGEFIVFAIRDISDEKRRFVLERLFFHDVLNAAGGLQGLMEILPDTSGEENRETYQMASNLAAHLVEEIQAQRDLRAAERGDLAPVFRDIAAEDLLTQVKALYAHHPVAAGKTIVTSCSPGGTKISSEPTLLARVLGNLVKNALEASSAGQTVTVSFENNGVPAFSVHNQSPMPRNVQLQLFQRSFSTKEGSGRGVGTYSVKLLTERYLKGKVAFSSSEDDGTTFTITLASS
jgi:K+-sensing histidine kinase KdpD